MNGRHHDIARGNARGHPPIRRSTDSPFTQIPVTKLLIPRAATHTVRRNRLAVRLETGLSHPLTLLSAPAGYGKTTAVAEWLHSRPRTAQAVAWLSLDEGDNDAVQFARLLLTAAGRALTEASGETGDPVLAALRFQELPSLRGVCTLLINKLTACPHEVILVFDDYHLIRAPAVHGAIVHLLERLPSNCHLIVLTRADPPFPLARLRADRQICELRAADLRFSMTEVTAFLRDVMGLRVSAAVAEALETRTEGWIVGLKLAALSMTGPDASGFVAPPRGSTHAALDYLTSEVLARLSPALQTFLMRTSVLNRLTGALCEAVLGPEVSQHEAEALLEQIERANLFLVRLDGTPRWYRYHQLFADLLRAHLRRTEPSIVADLHRRASGWYETHGFASEAIRHALAAPDTERAARLIEQHGMTVFYLGQLHTILDWFNSLPSEVAASGALRSIIHAYASYGTNKLDIAERDLHVAESRLTPALPETEARPIRGHIIFLRALLAGTRGDVSQSIALAESALNLLPASDPGYAFARVWAARAYSVDGDVTSKSERVLAGAVEQARAAGALVALRVGLMHLARMHMLQGRLTRAAAVFAETERILGVDVAFGAPGYCFRRAEMLRQRDDLDEAERFLAQGAAVISERNVMMPYTAAEGYGTLALVRQGRGDGHGAFAAVDELVTQARERQFDSSVLTHAAAIRAHLWMMQGNLTAAGHWADTSGLSPNDLVGFRREYEYLVLARVLIARRSEAASLPLTHLLENAEANARLGSAIEILALRAVAYRALGDKVRALQDLERALAIGEPEGYVRVFVDAGPAMATLLRWGRARGMAPEYCTRVLSAFEHRAAESTRPGLASASVPLSLSAARGVSTPLAEPLTAREADVLGLLVQGASNKEIAGRLFLTTSTVKKHLHHIFSKLDVRSRAQLIARSSGFEAPRP